MTAVESLPAYAEAEAVARRRGDNLISLLNAYLAGYAAGNTPERDERGYPVLRVNPDYPGIVRPEIRDGAVVLPEGWDDDE